MCCFVFGVILLFSLVLCGVCWRRWWWRRRCCQKQLAVKGGNKGGQGAGQKRGRTRRAAADDDRVQQAHVVVERAPWHAGERNVGDEPLADRLRGQERESKRRQRGRAAVRAAEIRARGAPYKITQRKRTPLHAQAQQHTAHTPQHSKPLAAIAPRRGAGRAKSACAPRRRGCQTSSPATRCRSPACRKGRRSAGRPRRPPRRRGARGRRRRSWWCCDGVGVCCLSSFCSRPGGKGGSRGGCFVLEPFHPPPRRNPAATLNNR